MAIRPRKWTHNGKTKNAWVVDYFDAKKKRRLKTFRTKKEAQDWAAEMRLEMRQGTHVADRDSITLAEAGKLWIATAKDNGLEAATVELYEQSLELHMAPFIGTKRLNELNVPALRVFQDALRADGRSPDKIKKVMTHLGSLFADAQERGLATRNPVRERKRGKKPADRHERQLEIGVDIPAPAEIRVIIHAATGFRRAFFVTAAMTGMRASELRGLTWADVDLTRASITVRQRADKWGNIGSPKAAASRRTIPLPPMVVAALKEWGLSCPKRKTGKTDADGEPIRELHYVFPNGAGKVELLSNIRRRHWHPLQIEAGISVPVLDDAGNQVQEPLLDDDGNPVIGNDGTPIMRDVTAAKYTGLHALRHFYASWCAAPVKNGGLGLDIKTVQVRMGHSTLAMTADTYGHLFPSQDDADVLAAGERALMGS